VLAVPYGLALGVSVGIFATAMPKKIGNETLESKKAG
jgi:hypothetical protein